MPKILAFAGSYREHSYNKRVLNIAVDGARAAGGDVTLIDLRELPMPIYNGDEHDRDGTPENALKFQELLSEHDGFLVSTPEYNGSVPGGFKNAIDWASRQSEKYKTNQVFKDKTAAIITASLGQFGGLRCLQHLRGVFTIMGAWVLPMEIAVPFVGQKFDGDSYEINDEKVKATVESLGAALVEALK